MIADLSHSENHTGASLSRSSAKLNNYLTLKTLVNAIPAFSFDFLLYSHPNSVLHFPVCYGIGVECLLVV